MVGRELPAEEERGVSGGRANRSGIRLDLIGWKRILTAAVGARLVVMVMSYGTNDVYYWSQIAEGVATHGLIETYRMLPALNHPPLAALFVSQLYLLADALNVPFAWALKTPAILADLVSARLIWVIWLSGHGGDAARRWTSAFLLCPAVIALSAYHGNTDSLLACLALAGAWAAQRNRWGWAGLLLGLAVNVKLLALCVTVAVVFSVRDRRDLGRLAFGAMSTSLPLLVALARDPQLVIGKVFGYVPAAEPWGIPWILSGFDPRYVARPAEISQWYLDHGTWLVVGSLFVAAILARRHRVGPLEAAFAGACAFLVFSPSIGVQHLALMLPLAFATVPRARYFLPTISSVFLLVSYATFATQWLPLTTEAQNWPVPIALLALAVWAAAALGLSAAVDGVRSSPEAAPGPATPPADQSTTSEGLTG
ncbi:MAG: glycosyltransferase 87 family protein [Acidimicrobiia bacterium]